MKRNKPRVVWLQGVTCNGNTHSFLCSNPSRFEQFNNSFDLIYHPSLTDDISIDKLLSSRLDIDFLLVEGAITSNRDFFQISNHSVKYVLNKLAKKSKYIISVGSCAVYGGVHKKFTLNDDLDGVNNSLDNKKEVINLTGCPVNPEWILQTLFTLKRKGAIPLDENFRPIESYGILAHHGCTRNEYFEWKVETKNFGTKEGCLFYEQGCRGPMTYSNCNKILWNGISSKTRVGMPCIGCTEFDFPRDNMLETKKNIGIPLDVPTGISKRAYLSLTGVAKTFTIERLEEKIIDYSKIRFRKL